MKKINLILALLIFSIIFCQDEIIHINKTHYDGTPSEVIIYKRVNEDLKSDNPFQIVGKFTYDSKGNYIRTGFSKKIIGQWVTGEDFKWFFYPDGTFKEFEFGEEDGLIGRWQLNNTEPLTLKLVGAGQEAIFGVAFINNYEVEFIDDSGYKMIFKRIGGLNIPLPE